MTEKATAAPACCHAPDKKRNMPEAGDGRSRSFGKVSPAQAQPDGPHSRVFRLTFPARHAKNEAVRK
jgi:hypothetical protein